MSKTGLCRDIISISKDPGLRGRVSRREQLACLTGAIQALALISGESEIIADGEEIRETVFQLDGYKRALESRGKPPDNGD